MPFAISPSEYTPTWKEYAFSVCSVHTIVSYDPVPIGELFSTMLGTMLA